MNISKNKILIRKNTFLKNYFLNYSHTVKKLDYNELEKITNFLEKKIKKKNTIFIVYVS